MIHNLPLKFISAEDKDWFSEEIINSAKLKRLDFPVPDGIAICFPEDLLKAALVSFGSEDFEQNLKIIENKLKNILLPEELEKEFPLKSNFYLSGNLFKSKNELWQGLLKLWLEDLRSLLWRKEHKATFKIARLSKLVLFISSPSTDIEAHFNPQLKEVMIKSPCPLDPKISFQIDQLVEKANKILTLPFIYSFILTNKGLRIVKLSPFTNTKVPDQEQNHIEVKKTTHLRPKTVMKIFLATGRNFNFEEIDLDGIVVEGNLLKDFDQAVITLTGICDKYPDKKILLKLADFTKDINIHPDKMLAQSKLCKDTVKAFLFLRNKKDLLNLSLIIPAVRSQAEFLDIKKELASFGIFRKASLNIWLEVGFPENLINLEDYLKSGIDGVLINLDFLQRSLHGYSLANNLKEEDLASVLAKKYSAETLHKFIGPFLKSLHKENLPFLVSGNLVLSPNNLDFLISQGAWGIVSSVELEARSLHETLSWAERRFLAKKFI